MFRLALLSMFAASLTFTTAFAQFKDKKVDDRPPPPNRQQATGAAAPPRGRPQSRAKSIFTSSTAAPCA